LVDDDALDHSTILAKAYGVLESGTILDVECCRLDEYRETRFSVLYSRLADNPETVAFSSNQKAANGNFYGGHPALFG
jgi:hypothetical protein